MVKTMILIKRGSVAIFRLLAMVVTCAICTLAYGASFNCGQAKTLVEKSICAKPPLSQLDDSMAVTYKNALTLGGEKVRVDQIFGLGKGTSVRTKFVFRISSVPTLID